jgi:hypothetical protein
VSKVEIEGNEQTKPALALLLLGGGRVPDGIALVLSPWLRVWTKDIVGLAMTSEVS